MSEDRVFLNLMTFSMLDSNSSLPEPHTEMARDIHSISQLCNEYTPP
jgi:hypothetical protein